MSFPPWYIHLPYGISLSLQMCTRNRISPPKNVHKSHTEMKNSLVDTNRQRDQGEKRARDDGMNKENDAWGVQDEWEMKLKQKTKQNATKHTVNMTC